MGRPFEEEVTHLPAAIDWACGLDVAALRRALEAAAGHNLLVVGSGGSSTVATFMAALHERRFGDVSKSITPLEYSLSASELRNSFSVMLSAEGKNKDILAAASQVATKGQKGIALTLTKTNPLTVQSAENGMPTPFSYDMPWIKDGYLATNSLIAMMVLVAKVYSQDEPQLEKELRKLDASWLQRRRQNYRESAIWQQFAPNQPVIILYGERGKTTAVDIESKLAESALAFCQPIDYRQFAHGRHLQLKTSEATPIILALISPEDRALAQATLNLLPAAVPVHQLTLPADPSLAEIVGTIEAILLTEAVAIANRIDPGQPHVPGFGRDIHALDVKSLTKCNSPIAVPAIFRRKLPWVAKACDIPSHLFDSLREFIRNLELARFRGLVCDFDGTYCDTNLRYQGLDALLVPHIERLLEAGIAIGFATGRGDSLQTDLRTKIKRKYWSQILIGYYSGSNIQTLEEDFTPPPPDSRFAGLEQWLRSIGLVNDKRAIRANAGQLGLGCENTQLRTYALSAIHHWIEANRVIGWRAYASGHSIDVITEHAGKAKVVEAIAAIVSCDPLLEILRIGDSGQFDGNDFELLNIGYGLSVASVSSLPGVGWNLLPLEKSNSAGTLHYLSMLEIDRGSARFNKRFFEEIRSGLEGYWPESRVEI
jgi:fructoselysine-6-P-deglycase FrlB-like protein